MTLALGIKAPLDASVFKASSLAFVPRTRPPPETSAIPVQALVARLMEGIDQYHRPIDSSPRFWLNLNCANAEH
jgi:hypothetical protein